MDALDAVGIYVHKFMRLQQRLNLWPHSGKQRMKFAAPQIAEPQMHDPRRRRVQNNAFREIRVL